MPVVTEISSYIRASHSGSNAFGGTFDAFMQAMLQTTDGVGVQQADAFYMNERQVASGANDDVDLSGVLLNVYGQVIVNVKLVAIFLINAPKNPLTAANITNLTIGAGTNPFLGFLGGTLPTFGPIRPGGFFQLGAGHLSGLGTVTPATGDILRIANTAGAIANYQLMLLGRSA